MDPIIISLPAAMSPPCLTALRFARLIETLLRTHVRYFRTERSGIRVGSTVLARHEVEHAFCNAGTETVRLLSVAGAGHHAFFVAVEEADREQPFSAMSPQDAGERVGRIGAATDSRFDPPA